MNQPTRDEKISTLRNAGKKVPNTATDEEIDFAILELEAEREEMEKEGDAAIKSAGETLQQVEAAEPETSETESARTYATLRDFAEAARLLSDPKLGNKTPELIEWAKANLSPDDLADIYPNL